jgi:hypothetical protein
MPALIERAQAALAEIAARKAGDTAQAEQDAAERAAREKARRADLIRWAGAEHIDGRDARESELSDDNLVRET